VSSYKLAVMPSNMNLMLASMTAIKTIFLNFSWSILVSISLPTYEPTAAVPND